MIKCEKCLYRKNCQFLATHKKTAVEGCTAFKSESDLKAEAFKEFANMILSPFRNQKYLSKRDLEIIVENIAKYC